MKLQKPLILGSLPALEEKVDVPGEELATAIEQMTVTGLRPLVLNQSARKTYDNCRRLYAWIRIVGLEPPIRRSATEIGTAVHAGLRVAHGEGGTVEAGQKEAAKMLKHLAGPSEEFADKKLSDAQDIVDRVFPAYFVYWSDQGEVWSPLDAEVQFLVEVGNGTGIYLRGRADNLSIHAGGLWLVDYKTSGKMDPRDMMKYELDIQLSSYIYGLNKQFAIDAAKEGTETVAVRGAIIDLLVKTQVPQFARETYTRSEAELEEFEREWIEIGQEIRKRHARVASGEDFHIVFPKNTEHCFRYGTCAYRDLCLKDTPARRAAYTQRKPDYVDEAQAQLEKAWAERKLEMNRVELAEKTKAYIETELPDEIEDLEEAGVQVQVFIESLADAEGEEEAEDDAVAASPEPAQDEKPKDEPTQ